MKRLLLPLAALAIAGLAVAACGDNGDTTASPIAEKTATVTPAAAETPALEPVPLRPATRIPVLDETIVEQPCTFDAVAGEIDCGQDGLYAPAQPLPAGQVERCDIFLKDDEPIAVACALPATTLYFELPQ
ncbi:MAG: hypothetical protein Q8Q00_05480 [Dehalococcoidia bacterium]|nr:hypothetical protein [Dehalococcoidia bacterium]